MPRIMLLLLAAVMIFASGCHERSATHKRDAEKVEPRVVNIPESHDEILNLAEREANAGDYGVALVLAHQVLKVDADNARARKLVDHWKRETGMTLLLRETERGEVYPDWYYEAVERANRRFHAADTDDYANPVPYGNP